MLIRNIYKNIKPGVFSWPAFLALVFLGSFGACSGKTPQDGNFSKEVSVNEWMQIVNGESVVYNFTESELFYKAGNTRKSIDIEAIDNDRRVFVLKMRSLDDEKWVYVPLFWKPSPAGLMLSPIDFKNAKDSGEEALKAEPDGNYYSLKRQ